MKNLFNKERLFTVILSVVISSIIFVTMFVLIRQNEPVAYKGGNLPANYLVNNTHFPPSNDAEIGSFTSAAMTAIPAVVHIRTTFPRRVIKQRGNDDRRNPFKGNPFFDDFFGFGPQVVPEQQASGSGVVVSENGYIVTNNHVISDESGNVAKKISVTFNNRQEYEAELIGNDASSDLAVIKINAKKLPYLVYGNSDYVSIGQWVLAVGYPLNLDATVTAGIISAKSRTLGINYRNQNGEGAQASAIESFLQTDAAVNKGNSGGALVNLKGEFIGVNSAIATPTGYYSGYSFSIPSNMVKKIVGDIIKYGKAQRGFLGIEFPNGALPKEELEKRDMYVESGVYVSNVLEGGAAMKAGIEKGDVITKIDGKVVIDGSALSARLAMYKPGDKVKLTYERDGKEKTAYVVLKNNLGTYDISKKKSPEESIGATFEELSDRERDKYQIHRGGLRVVKIQKNGLLSKTRMDEGFIIVSVSGRSVETEEDLYQIFKENAGRTLKLEGFYPNSNGLYSYPITLE